MVSILAESSKWCIRNTISFSKLICTGFGPIYVKWCFTDNRNIWLFSIYQQDTQSNTVFTDELVFKMENYLFIFLKSFVLFTKTRMPRNTIKTHLTNILFNKFIVSHNNHSNIKNVSQLLYSFFHLHFFSARQFILPVIVCHTKWKGFIIIL